MPLPALLAALLVSAALLPLPAAAQDAPPSACDRLASPYEQSACLEAALGRADAALNEAYRRAQAVIDADAATPAADRAAWKRALQAAQRAWIGFRDADCGELVGHEWHQGSGSGPAALACRLDKTERRARALVERYTAR
jgi:uncharacterized protein YecT (DUF1311 family)